jgi:deoxyadenosine kinase
MNNLTITISGIIGAGKSTLAKQLASRLKATVLEEPVSENEYLSKFYANMKKYSFPMQIYFLTYRFQQQLHTKANGITIQDRSIYEDIIFAKMLKDDGLMEELDYKTYSDLYKTLTDLLHIPDVIIYLDVDPIIALERIKQRARGCELNGISLEYLKSLKVGYEQWLQDIQTQTRVIKVDWNKFRNIKHIEELL